MKPARILLAAVAAVSATLVVATPASAGHVRDCTDEYVAALTDEYMLFYADYPYTYYARERTADYLRCVR